MEWPLGEAKNKFSEVFDRALKDGPQRIVRRGKDRAVLISETEYRRIAGKGRRKQPDFIEFLLSAPKFGDLDVDREKAPLRGPKL